MAEEILTESFGQEFHSIELLSQKEEIQQDNKKFQLITTVDKNWLYDETRVYPITIDPTILHDTSAEFAIGSFVKNKDSGSGSAPVIESYYQETNDDSRTMILWHMNESIDNSCAGGEDLCDSSGNSRDGIATGTSISTTGILGSARVFDGNDSVTTGTIINFGSQSFSVEMWVKATNYY